MSQQVNNDVITKMNLSYIDELAHYHTLKAPPMPNFSISAYTDNEYQIAIKEIMRDYQDVDDYELTLQFLRETDGS